MPEYGRGPIVKRRRPYLVGFDGPLQGEPKRQGGRIPHWTRVHVALLIDLLTEQWKTQHRRIREGPIHVGEVLHGLPVQSMQHFGKCVSSNRTYDAQYRRHRIVGWCLGLCLGFTMRGLGWRQLPSPLRLGAAVELVFRLAQQRPGFHLRWTLSRK